MSSRDAKILRESQEHYCYRNRLHYFYVNINIRSRHFPRKNIRTSLCGLDICESAISTGCVKSNVSHQNAILWGKREHNATIFVGPERESQQPVSHAQYDSFQLEFHGEDGVSIRHQCASGTGHHSSFQVLIESSTLSAILL